MSESFDGVPLSCINNDHPSSILRDIKLVFFSFVATCILICAYNYSLRRRCELIEEKANLDTKETPSRSIIANLPSEIDNQIGTCASGDFLNAILSQLWNHINIAVSNTIKEMMEPMLADLKVPIHFIKLDMGDNSFKTENMFVRRVDSLSGDGRGKRKRKQQGVQIDFDLGWDGNCDILLQATLSKSVKLTFGVQNIKVSGRFGLLLGPLTTDLPVVSAVQYGFTNPPDIQLTYAGCVKSLSDKLAFVEGALKSIIDSTLAGMLVLPFRMVMGIDLGSYDFLETYTPPAGMLRVGVSAGRGFKILKKMIINDIPDTYCLVSLGASKPFRNTTQYDNLNPQWEGETSDFILYDMEQKIYVSVFDEDKGPMDPDDLLGKCEITARDLLGKGGQAELELSLNNKMTGCFVTIDAEKFNLSKNLMSFRLPEFDGKDKLCGLLTIIITKAFDIPLKKEDCATCLKVVYGKGTTHEQTFWTGTVADYPGIDALNPMFDSAFHIPVTTKMLEHHRDSEVDAIESPTHQSTEAADSQRSLSRSKSVRSVVAMARKSLSKKVTNGNDIEITLIDVNGNNRELGSITITHKALIDAHKHTLTETRPIGSDGAKLEFQVSMAGVLSDEDSALDLSDIDESDSGNLELNGGEKASQTILLTALRGRGFVIHQRGFGKKDDVPDIYLSVPQLDWKTSVVKDDTQPNWNESKVYTTKNAREIIRVDAFDKNSKSKDEYIGTAKFPLDQLLRKRIMEVELLNGLECTHSYVTMQCVPRASSEDEDVSDDVATPLLSTSAPPVLSSPAFGMNGDGHDEDNNIANNTIVSMASTSSRRQKMFRSRSLPSPKAFMKSLSSSNKGIRSTHNGAFTGMTTNE